MIDAMPYSVASADDFEMAIQVISRTGIKSVMAERTSSEKREWLLAAFLTDSFAAELASAAMLFPEVWDEIVPERS